jgi:hypothetical protein
MNIENILELKIPNTEQSIFGIKTTIGEKFGFASAVFHNEDIELMKNETDLIKRHRMFQELRIKKVYSLVDQVGAFAMVQGDYIIPTEEEFINFNNKFLTRSV